MSDALRTEHCVCGEDIVQPHGVPAFQVLSAHYAGSIHSRWSAAHREPGDVVPVPNPYQTVSYCAWPGCPVETPRRLCYFHARSAA